MLYSQVALAAGAALLAAQDAHAFFIWWPFSEPVISPFAFTGCIKRTSTWTSFFTASAPNPTMCVVSIRKVRRPSPFQSRCLARSGISSD